jgi:hypothetical protein
VCPTKRHESWRRGWCTALVAVGCFVSSPCLGVSAVIEVADDVQALVDVRLARRLIRLELADVELPQVNSAAPNAVPQGATQKSEEVVFVRLLRQGDTLVVELWAKGEFSGERRLSTSDNEQHQARRVALASAELARRVREVRVVERQRVLQEHLVATAASSSKYLTPWDVGLDVGVSSAWWADADTPLLGPRVTMWAVTESGVGLGITGAAMTAMASGVVSSWTELALRPSWGTEVNSALSLGVGLQLGASVVGISRQASFPSSEVSQQTWATKVALDARAEWAMNPRMSVFAAPEFGWMLRALAVETRERPRSLDGVWLGVSLGVSAQL